MSLLLVIAEVVLLAITLATRVNAYQVVVYPHDRECFYEQVVDSTQVSLTFEVAEGGFMDIHLLIMGPGDRIIHNEQGLHGGKMLFEAYEDGEYHYCFHNQGVTFNPKLIAFHVDITLPPGNQTAESTNSTDLTQLAEELIHEVHSISTEQHYMEIRERVHHLHSEATNQRVVIWSLFEVILVVAMTVGQVVYIKRILAVRRYV